LLGGAKEFSMIAFRRTKRWSLCASLIRLAAGVFALGALVAPAPADQVTDICLKNGASVHVVQIESIQGAFLLHLVGGVTMNVASDEIKAFGQSCGSSPDPVPVAQDSHFAIYGSNTIGERLMPMIIDKYASAVLGKPAKFTPRVPEEQTIELRSANGSEPAATIDFQAHGSGTAFPALLQSQIQIGMSSRQIKADEIAKFKDKFNVDMISAANEHVLGLDGLAVIVNSKNPIKNLSVEQLAKIFSGQVLNWSDVSGVDDSGKVVQGDDLPIAIHARDDKSGTYDTFKTLVLGKTTPPSALAPSAQRYNSSEDLSAAVAKNTGAIGFIGLPYVNDNHALGIVGACGLTSLPTTFGVKTEQYALTRRLYLYTVGEPTKPTAKALLEFALSDDAQAVVKQADFVDQSVEFVGAAEQQIWSHGLLSNPNGYLPDGQQVPSSASRAFKDASNNVGRSSIVFRFQTGSSELDVLADQNIVRLKNYLSKQSVSVNSVWVVGFADSQGGWNANYALSLERARAVMGKLSAIGVSLPARHALPFSYMAPVACNDDDAGRAKNRRVEVWISR
jgi:phosphate transport system substrate-binding protein